MILWRVENADGDGPFDMCILEGFNRKYHNMTLYPNLSHDRGLHGRLNLLCRGQVRTATCDIDMLHHWFGDVDVLDVLTAYELQIVKIEVADFAVVVGHMQAVFETAHRTTLRTYPVSALPRLVQSDNI